MKKKSSSRPDYVLLAILTALISLGIVVLAGISAPLSQDKFGNTTYYLIHQIQYGIIPGFFLGLLAYIIPLELIKKWSLIIFLAVLYETSSSDLNLLMLMTGYLKKTGIAKSLVAKTFLNRSSSTKISSILSTSFSISRIRRQASALLSLITLK